MISKHRALIEHTAAGCGLDPRVIEAQVFVESSDRADAFRYEPAFYGRYVEGRPQWAEWGPLAACSYGLLQVMFVVAVECGFKGQPQHLFNPLTGLQWGIIKLNRMVNLCGGNMDVALASYNGGVAGNLKPPYRNALYVGKVHTQLALLT